jgi:hypothetical protein
MIMISQNPEDISTVTAGPVRSVPAEGAPIAMTLGAPAVHDHSVVALEVGPTESRVVLHRWTDDCVQGFPLALLAAHVWARAGRLTLMPAQGGELELTLLAAEEHNGAVLGEHWPLGEPDSRAKRIAAAAARDVGEVLTFPMWLTHTVRTSAGRNKAVADTVRQIYAVCPDAVIHHGQTARPIHHQPGQHHPYDRRGLVGHEGYPTEI